MEPALNLWAPDFHADDFPTVNMESVKPKREREPKSCLCAWQIFNVRDTEKGKTEKEIRTEAHNVEDKKQHLDTKPFLVSTY